MGKEVSWPLTPSGGNNASLYPPPEEVYNDALSGSKRATNSSKND